MKSILLVARLLLVMWFLSALHILKLETIEVHEGRVENICKGSSLHLPRSPSRNTEAENQHGLLEVPNEIMEVNQDVPVQMEKLSCIQCRFRLFCNDPKIQCVS